MCVIRSTRDWRSATTCAATFGMGVRHMLLLFSRLHKGPLRNRIGTQLERLARHPDPGSFFDQLTQPLRNQPDGVYLASLLAVGYDCVLAFERGGIAGYLAHQRLEAVCESHCFSIRAMTGFQGQRLGTRMAAFWLRIAYGQGAVRTRLWAGDQLAKLKDAEKMHRLYARIVSNRADLPFEVCAHDCGEPGWINLRPTA